MWSKVGHFSKALSKGVKTTTWIWNLHADCHDFDIQQPTQAIPIKVFSANLGHLAVVFFWLGGMHFHGAYFSNISAWHCDPKHVQPSAQIVWSIVGQDILNADVGGYFQGLYITSGFFQLWRSEGIISMVHLKYAATAAGIMSILCLIGGYCHMHINFATPHFYRKFKCLAIHHLALFLGFGSLAWSAHQIHVSLPINRFLDAGIDPSLIPWPQDLLFGNIMRLVFRRFGTSPLVDFSLFLPKGVSLFSFAVNGATGAIFLGIQAAHHFYLAVTLILSAFVLQVWNPFLIYGRVQFWPFSPRNRTSDHAQLTAALLLWSTASMVFAHHSYALSCYPYLATDYATVLCLFTHHAWICGFLLVGAGAHAGIFMVRDFGLITANPKSTVAPSNTLTSISLEILNHRCIVTGHLAYVTLWLGLHSFGLYVHNDTLQALSRPASMFSDNAIQLKPIFGIWVQSLRLVSFDIELLDNKIVYQTQELGTADFMVHHIHAFTIHCTLLILLKGVLYARNSRLIADKAELGFRYPCDGPGRGGTCQVSPWDHVFLGVFWMYNCISVVIFHFFWKMQSDVWGTYNSASNTIEHISGGDWSVNSGTINGWLRNFLWSQEAQVIQSYGSSLSQYGLVFLIAHFVWAFSLMFLFSGRGYWQELIESILWAHHKLKVVPAIQPRALSISHGRAVGVTHYILGGIGVTNAFFQCRIISLS